MRQTTLFTLALSLLFTTVGLSGDYNFDWEDKAPLEASAESELEKTFRTDGWIVQLNVGLTQTALGLTDDMFIGFGDIISNVDWIAPLGMDLRYKRFGFDTDIVAMKLSGGSTRPGPFFSRAGYDLKLGVFGFLGYYRLVDQPSTKLDLMGGARLLWVDLDINLSGGPLGTAIGPASAGTSIENWDGLVALRFEQDLSEKIFCSVYGDVGTGASDLTWQVLGSVGYRHSESLTSSLGYRYLNYDISSGATDLGLSASGVQITINKKF